MEREILYKIIVKYFDDGCPNLEEFCKQDIILDDHIANGIEWIEEIKNYLSLEVGNG